MPSAEKWTGLEIGKVSEVMERAGRVLNSGRQVLTSLLQQKSNRNGQELS